MDKLFESKYAPDLFRGGFLENNFGRQKECFEEMV
jgi:hypothetical protein